VYFQWQPYVPVAERRRQAEQKVATLKKKGQPITPVKIEGRTIATSFWGKAWCTNLERYSDFESRLPRGRTYVRNGSVVDLQIASGEVTALVAGSELYKIRITIAPVKRAAWKSICRDCAGTVSSLVELLQGRLSKGVMDRVCRKGDGLFPAPKDIELSCSCPDWASMCKHVAAALYGVGARLDSKPELIFALRGVDQADLLSAAPEISHNGAAPVSGNVLDDGDVAALFGLEMADRAVRDTATTVAVAKPGKAAPGRRGRLPAANPPAAPAPTAKASAGRGTKGAGRPAKVETSAADAVKAPRPARTKGKAAKAAPRRANAGKTPAKKAAGKAALRKAARGP
jgi:uncharacterized Zn finger protein